jgi:hypothetical protein
MPPVCTYIRLVVSAALRHFDLRPKIGKHAVRYDEALTTRFTTLAEANRLNFSTLK